MEIEMDESAANAAAKQRQQERAETIRYAPVTLLLCSNWEIDRTQ
jgi:hypothetical protein